MWRTPMTKSYYLLITWSHGRWKNFYQHFHSINGHQTCQGGWGCGIGTNHYWTCKCLWNIVTNNLLPTVVFIKKDTFFVNVSKSFCRDDKICNRCLLLVSNSLYSWNKFCPFRVIHVYVVTAIKFFWSSALGPQPPALMFANTHSISGKLK